MSVKITGISNLMRKLKEVAKEHPEAVAAGMYAVANDIMNVAKQRCPVDTGVLRASGFVAEPKEVEGSMVVNMGFGGAAAAYAVKQHEDLTLQHPGGGQPKFLESAVDEARAGFAARVAVVAKKHIESGGSHE